MIFLKRLLVKAFSLFILLADYIVPKRHEFVIIASSGGLFLSGNSLALYGLIKEDPALRVCYYIRKARKSGAISFKSAGDIWFFLRTKILVITHSVGDVSPYRISSRKVVINLWHGMPTKGMGIAQNHIGRTELENAKKALRFNFFLAPSRVAAQRFNYCVQGYRTTYLLCGQPRNDVLVASRSQGPVCSYLDKTTRAVLYAPTYRSHTTTKWFPFDEFDVDDFNMFLIENKLTIYLRPHVNDKDSVGSYLRSNVKMLSTDVCTDVYAVLASIDCLLTDYSSLYTDFLLCNKPIVFIHTDYMEYESYNSFLNDRCEFWYPGDKPHDFSSFKQSLVDAFERPEKHQKGRLELNRIVNYYEDGCSCEKVARFIKAGDFDCTHREIIL